MKRTPTPLTLSVADTAMQLSLELGGAPEQWRGWLKNDRKPGRGRRLAVEPGPGRPRYHRDTVDAFIAEQKMDEAGVPNFVDVGIPDQGELPLLLENAVLLNDDQLRDELAAGSAEGSPVDFVAFEVLAGLDQHNQPTIWVRSGLRDGMHYAITLPFTHAELLKAARR